MPAVALTNSNYSDVLGIVRKALQAEGRWPRSASGKNTAVTNKAQELGYSREEAIDLGDYAEQMYE